MFIFYGLIILVGLLTLFFYGSYRRLVHIANQRFEAWENVLVSQRQLLDSLSLMVETLGVYMPKDHLKTIIHSTKQLLLTDDADIEHLGHDQQQWVGSLLAFLQTGFPEISAHNLEPWLVCQDEIVAALDDFYLAQVHYNHLAHQYNRWRNALWVYWMADALRYPTHMPTLPLAHTE